MEIGYAIQIDGRSVARFETESEGLTASREREDDHLLVRLDLVSGEDGYAEVKTWPIRGVGTLKKENLKEETQWLAWEARMS